jgi:Uma2 family endonuclease
MSSASDSLGLAVSDIWQVSVEKYHQMIQEGSLNDDDPVELLDGFLVTKEKKTPAHTYSTSLTREFLEKYFLSGYFVDKYHPFTTATSEPEPDLTVIKGKPRDYLARHPFATEVLLVIEIADTSLNLNRMFKQSIYASAGIPIYWILNLNDRQLEVYTNPVPNEKRYEEKTIYDADSLAPVIIDGQEIAQLAVKNLLP